MAVVRILIKQKKLTPSEIAAEDAAALDEAGKDQAPAEGDSPGKGSSKLEESVADQSKVETAPVERIVEMDQDDKALSVVARPNSLQYSAYVINEYAARCHRRDFLEQIVRQCFDFFDGKPERQKEI